MKLQTPPLTTKEEKRYWEEATPEQKTAICVAYTVLPNIYCIVRSQGFQKSK
jgi:hypothetical protein